jgi:uncharacterized protein YjbI with pentapeptide repeats
MAKKKTARKGWEESMAHLKGLGVAVPAEDARQTPQAGQKKFRGLTVRGRTFEEVELSGLCLVRALFVNCRFHGVSLGDSDLTLSCLHGCQFMDCDFRGARLIRADLGECGFFACRFTRAELTGADLRGSTFEHCDFEGAVLTGACFDHALKGVLKLSAAQRDVMVDWRQEGDEGPDED